MLPNFLVIGGQRCATGWISQCLREHPQIFMAPDETRFFDWHYDKGLAWWEKNYLQGWTEQPAVGEKTANYLTDPQAPQRIHNTLPNAKLICCLRNPVERMYSGLMLKSRNQPSLKTKPLQELLEQEPDLVERGLYAKHLSRYLDLFPSDQIQVLLFDDKDKDPLAFIQSIYSSLGVDNAYAPPSLKIQTKPGARENARPLLSLVSRVLMHRRSPLRSIYSKLRPGTNTMKFSPHELEKLQHIYAHDIDSLEKLISRDLSAWKD